MKQNITTLLQTKIRRTHTPRYEDLENKNKINVVSVKA